MRRILLIAFLALSLNLAYPPGPCPAARAEESLKTLVRRLDPVVARGDATRPFWGRRIDNMRLYVRHFKTWEPIPYQIDKVNADGDYFINENTISPEVREEAGFDDLSEEKKHENRIKKFERMRGEYEKRIQTGEITRDQLKALECLVYAPENMACLDWNDELVFMARDSGNRAPKSDWLTIDALEIQVTDPLNGEKGWVYLFYFDADPPPPSDVDYVQYDPKDDRVVTPLSEIGFMPDKPMIVNSIIGKPPGQPVMPNILDRFKLRIRLKLYIFLCIPLHFDENNARGVTIGYKDGPVRVLRRNLFWIVIGGVKLPFAPKIGMVFKFYENGLTASSDLYLPVNPRYYVCKGSTFVAGLDFRKSIDGARIFTRDNKDLVIDGKMSEQEKNLMRPDQDWVAGYLPDKTALISRMRYDPEMIARGTKLDLFYLDDKTITDPPEGEEGLHMVGYTIGIKTLPQRYHLGFEIYTAYNFEPDQVRELLNIDDHPLIVTDTTPTP